MRSNCSVAASRSSERISEDNNLTVPAAVYMISWIISTVETGIEATSYGWAYGPKQVWRTCQ